MLERILCLFSLALVLCSSAWCQASPDVLVEHNVAMKTRDGVTLRADIYRPAGEGQFPVLLQRTPYDKNGDSRLWEKSRGQRLSGGRAGRARKIRLRR